mgnify:CR=1 FL=1
MAKIPILQTCPIHTLILDTTYCDPQVISLMKYYNSRFQLLWYEMQANSSIYSFHFFSFSDELETPIKTVKAVSTTMNVNMGGIHVQLFL